MHSVSWEPNWTQTHFRGNRSCASFLPTQSSPHSQAGAGTFRQGLWPQKMVRPWPHLLYVKPPGPAVPTPHTHLKLISDPGPWGIQDLLRNTHSLSSLLLPAPGAVPSSRPCATHLPPRQPNMPLHRSRVGRQAAAGPLDRGTLMQAMHAALAGAWGGRAPWPPAPGWGCMLAEGVTVLPPGSWAWPPL